MKIYLTAILLLAGLLFAENFFEICNQTFSKPGNEVTSYDVTHWTGSVDPEYEVFDSICVVVHSEKINENTSALVFSRWFITNEFMGNDIEDYLLQDTVLLETGTQINQVSFPVNTFYYMAECYEFDYIYFSRTKNNQTDFCRIRHLNGGNFAQPEVITTNMSAGASFTSRADYFLYNSDDKIFFKDLESKTTTVIDSGNSCSNPKILYSQLAWEKTFGDTVKTFYVDYSEYNHTWGVIKQFLTGDVRNLKLNNPHYIWESGTGINRRTFYSAYSGTIPPQNISQLQGNLQNFQSVLWYIDYSSYQIGDGDSSCIYFDCFPQNDYWHADSIALAKQPAVKLVGVYVVMGYAPWTYLQKVDGVYQLKAKMLYLPESGIDDGDKSEKQSVLINSYPNPFNNSTNISYQLPKSGLTSISVFNSSGQLVKDLLKEVLPSGEHGMRFKADNLNSGVYYLRINNTGIERCHKLLLIK